MKEKLTLFKKIRNIGKSNSRKKWYRTFCNHWDIKGSRGVLPLLNEYPEILTQLIKASKINRSTSNWPLSKHELYALRHPDLFNKCQGCGKPVGYDSISKNWFTGCSRSCAQKAKATRDKVKSTLVERYGDDNPSRVDKFKKKRTRTIREKFGVDNAFQAKPLMEKAKDTMLERYGVDHSSRSPEIQEKRMATSQERGNKNSGRIKKYTDFKDRFGVVHRICGFEDLAIAYFSNPKGITKNVKSITSKVIEVPKYRYTLNGTKHNYFPDLKVISGKSEYIVEVKSPYTLALDLERNLKKFKVASRSCIRKGQCFILMVFKDRLDTKPIIVRNPQGIMDLRNAGLVI